ncbi:DUF5067 domain-containing protein [Collinsella sp. AF38-3AC]|uniref:DUF5067 domain-containing protein n=1 Tax=Collinsella sp. AF38-3AC TaxID=2292015 RepID=UPI000E51319F|nr:DUF5067 domain-containing protein [Collinsella sp. AF38-3AC]RHL25396.1 DUF5067 domain-containing protein [Collinsella sp. AF38-3AC]
MKRIIVSAMTALAIFGFGAALAGCGTSTQGNQSNTIQSASVEPGDSSVNISVAGYRLGRGFWDVNASTETGASSGSLGAQKVLVCDLLLTNNSDTKTVISPVDLLCAVQDGEMLQFGALYDEGGSYTNPESVEVEPGQTASGVAIWNIDDLQTPVKIKFKCGGEVPLTIMPSKISEDDTE